MVFTRILVFITSILAGVLILKYTGAIVDMVGRSDWAERYLGFGTSGGTHNMWKLIGLLVIIIGVFLAIRGW